MKCTKSCVYGPMGCIGCVRCEKFPMRLHSTNLSITCTISTFFFEGHHFNLLCTEFRVVMKHCQMHPTLRNAPKHEFRVQWAGFCAFVAKNSDATFMAQTCALIAPVQPVLHQVLCSDETLTNAPKHYETHKNMSLGINWGDRVCSF